MGLESALVAVRGDASDDDTVRLACELLRPSKGKKRGKLYIIYVIEMDRALPLDAEIAPATARGEEVLKEVEEVVKGYKCEAHAELLQSRQTGYAVVQEAVEKQVDAIVLGTPYREQYGSFYLGQTVPYILKHAPCRVILWRDMAPDGAQSHGPRS